MWRPSASSWPGAGPAGGSLGRDGGFKFTAQALWTAAKFKIPFITLVLSNGGFQYAPGEDDFGFKFVELAID